MAKNKNTGDLFGALTMRQTDGLARTFTGAASNLMKAAPDEHDTINELFDLSEDLDASWTARYKRGESPNIVLAPNIRRR